MILHRVAVVALSLALSAGACRKVDAPSSERAPDATPKASTPAAQQHDEPTRSPKADVSPIEKVAAAIGLADGLPNLKPVIDKPFPAGATEEQVCEAIENTGEKDLWVRFGHLVPMYKWGSILIVQAKKSDVEALDKIIASDGVYAEHKTCNDAKTFIYAPSLPDVTREVQGRVTGRLPLIEKFSSQLGIKTLESFSFDDDQERLSDYCRADADLCEKLVKLDEMNEGLGLCARAVSRARLSTMSQTEKLKRCRLLPRDIVACTEYAFDGSEADQCRKTIRDALSNP